MNIKKDLLTTHSFNSFVAYVITVQYFNNSSEYSQLKQVSYLILSIATKNPEIISDFRVSSSS